MEEEYHSLLQCMQSILTERRFARGAFIGSLPLSGTRESGIETLKAVHLNRKRLDISIEKYTRAS
jgi:hypothetical protein